MRFIRTTSENKDFIKLIQLLDADLAERDGEEHSFFAQFNKIDAIKYVIVAYDGGTPIGCGAVKQFDDKIVEIKRMYTSVVCRGKGVASIVLSELEEWAIELGYYTCILETGIKQPEAIGLYLKNGYQIIPNYGQYANVKSSKCFKKNINIK